MQVAKNEYELYFVENAETLTAKENFDIVSGKYYFEVKEGQFNSEAIDVTADFHKDEADLSLYQVKSVNVKTGDTKPSDMFGTDYYQQDNCKETYAPTTTATKAYYKVVCSMKDIKPVDLGNAGVAIYAK